MKLPTSVGNTGMIKPMDTMSISTVNMMNGMENKSAGPRLYTIHG